MTAHYGALENHAQLLACSDRLTSGGSQLLSCLTTTATVVEAKASVGAGRALGVAPGRGRIGHIGKSNQTSLAPR
eukprot:5317466-Pleurochrysis_carterae.AAC.2